MATRNPKSPSKSPSGDIEAGMLRKVRPQIFLAILCGTLFGAAAIWVGMEMDAVEIVTGGIGSVFGFLGGVSLKILEAE